MNGVQNISKSFKRFDALYTPKILAEVNDTNIMLVKLDGDQVPWHKHENEDELFIVFSGCLEVCFRTKSHMMLENDVFKIPRNTEHKVIALVPSMVILIESKNFKHTGNTESDITQHVFEALS